MTKKETLPKQGFWGEFRYFLFKGKGKVSSVWDVAVLSGSPFEDSKKSEVSVPSSVLEADVLSAVSEDEVFSVLLVSDISLDEEEWDEEDEEDSEPIGLFLPHPDKSNTAHERTAARIRAKSFFIFILYILSKIHGKGNTAQQKFFPFALFLCKKFFVISCEFDKLAS